MLSPLEQVQFEAEVTVDTLPYLQDHRIAGAVVVPATAFVEMGLQAASTVSAGDGHELVDLSIREALLIEEHGESTVVQSILDPDPAAQDLAFHVTSRHDDEWKTHVTARLRARHPGDAAEQLDLTAAGGPAAGRRWTPTRSTPACTVSAWSTALRSEGSPSCGVVTASSSPRFVPRHGHVGRSGAVDRSRHGRCRAAARARAGRR